MPSGGTSEAGEGTSIVGSGIVNRNAITRSPASACTSAPGRAGLGRRGTARKRSRCAAPPRTAGRRGSPGASPSSRAATSVRGTAEASGCARGRDQRAEVVDEVPDAARRRASAPTSPASRCRACRSGCGRRGSSTSGSACRTPRARSRGFVGFTPAGTVRHDAAAVDAVARGAERAVVDEAARRALVGLGRARAAPRSRAPVAPSRAPRATAASPNPASSKRSACPASRNASTTSTIGQSDLFAERRERDHRGAADAGRDRLEQVLRRRRAVRRRHEPEGLALEVARRGLEEPRRDALAVAALAVAGRAVA